MLPLPGLWRFLIQSSTPQSSNRYSDFYDTQAPALLYSFLSMYSFLGDTFTCLILPPVFEMYVSGILFSFPCLLFTLVLSSPPMIFSLLVPDEAPVLPSLDSWLLPAAAHYLLPETPTSLASWHLFLQVSCSLSGSPGLEFPSLAGLLYPNSLTARKCCSDSLHRSPLLMLGSFLSNLNHRHIPKLTIPTSILF